MVCPRTLLLPAILALSAAAHAGVFVSLGTGPRPATAPSIVEITVAPVPPPPPAPAPPERAPVVEQARTAAPVPRTAQPRRVATRVAAPAALPPSPAPTPAPADFTGTTLTNDAGDAWVAQTGNGTALDGPIAAPRAPSPAPVARGTASREPAGPEIVALADLSRPPRAPDLNDALAHHYPVAARQRGIAGKAIVKARITSDGKARVIGVLSETFVGFGVACRRTLDGSRWEPPQDRAGQAVATELTYTCRFEVGS